MNFAPTSIPDVILIEPEVFGDERGFFMETFQAEQFARAGISSDFVQDNHSKSGRGILRGLHYQIRRPQGKLIRAVVGEIFDVAVDLRQSSPTFKQWSGTLLSAKNHLQLWVPAGFAHGFYVLSETAEVIYKTTDFYAPEWERCLIWNDPQIAIEWPLQAGQTPILSQKDARGRLIGDAELFE